MFWKINIKMMAASVVCLLFLALPVAQSTGAEEENIVTQRSQALRLCSPVVTRLVDGFLIFFSYVNPLLGHMLALPFMGPTVIALLVNPLESIMYHILSPLQRLSQGVTVQDIMPEDLYERLQAGEEIILIDVRAPAEYAQYHIPGAKNVPLREVVNFLKSGELPMDKPVVFICKSGFRSYLATMSALAHGYTNALNMHQGTDGGWIHDAGLPVVTE
jgi:rhodanese-related sulfurtransferase